VSPVVALVVDLVVVVVSAYGYRLWFVVEQQEGFEPRRVLAVVRLWWRVVPLTAVQAVLVVLLAVGGLVATYTAIVAAVIGLFATPAFDKGWAAGERTRSPRTRRAARVATVVHVVVGLALSLLGAISLLPLLVLPIVLLAVRVTRPSGEEETAPVPVAGADRVRREPERPTVVDDPGATTLDGALAALAEATALAEPDGTVWTVTPGVLGAGDRDTDAALAAANEELARAATDGERMRLGIVGRTHRHALRVGAVDTTGEIELFTTRDQAVAHVLARTGPGDVLLLAGDLPPHLP
jgi:hypothetical protein